jgi:hypothetical protein
MKMIYINRDNKAKVSDVSSSKAMVEYDGYHPIPSSTVFRNSQNKDDAICVVFQGRVMPFGDPQKKETLNQLFWEIYNTSLLDGKMDVDSALSRFVKLLLKSAVSVGIALFFVAIGVSAIMNGGV